MRVSGAKCGYFRCAFTLLSTRYQSELGRQLATAATPNFLQHTALASLGGALGVATHVGGVAGHQLAESARQAFIDAMGFAMLVGTFFAGAAALFVAALLPARAPRTPRSPSAELLAALPLHLKPFM